MPNTHMDVQNVYLRGIKDIKVMETLRHGTFGVMSKALLRERRCCVGLKQFSVRSHSDEFEMEQGLQHHENIVNAIARYYQPGQDHYYLLFDYCEYTLPDVLDKRRSHLNAPRVKMILNQLFSALYFVDTRKIEHNGLMPDMVVFNAYGTLKVVVVSERPYADNVTYVSASKRRRLWYMAPEMMLAQRNYVRVKRSAADLWAAGCIMVELLTPCSVLRGRTEQEQLTLISQLCGAIDHCVWKDVGVYYPFNQLKVDKQHRRVVRQAFAGVIRKDALDVVDLLLTLDPSARLAHVTYSFDPCVLMGYPLLTLPFFEGKPGDDCDLSVMLRCPLNATADRLTQAPKPLRQRRKRRLGEP